MALIASRPMVLALRALGLGDLLTGLPALRALRRAFPRHRLVLAAPGWLGAMALHARAADQVLATMPFDPIGVASPAVAVNLHGRGPHSHRALLATAPKRLLAFAHADVPESADGPPHPDRVHEVRRWCALLRAYGIDADEQDLRIAPPPIRAPRAARGATVIHPGAKDAARRWPADRWTALARAEQRAGRPVVVTGSRAEARYARMIAARAGVPRGAFLAGRTSLLGLAAIVADAERVVCGDTGIAHLATALGTPSVVLFGPTPPTLWGPPASPMHRVLWHGRTGDPHGTRPDPALLAIGVDEVRRALAALPRREGGDAHAPTELDGDAAAASRAAG